MESLKLDRNLAHLAVLQRIELTTPFQKKIRKLFGRYLFSKIFLIFFKFGPASSILCKTTNCAASLLNAKDRMNLINIYKISFQENFLIVWIYLDV